MKIFATYAITVGVRAYVVSNSLRTVIEKRISSIKSN
jgi:hypothetical protein